MIASNLLCSVWLQVICCVAVLVTRSRKLDLKLKQTTRSVFQCSVIGPKSAGKVWDRGCVTVTYQPVSACCEVWGRSDRNCREVWRRSDCNCCELWGHSDHCRSNLLTVRSQTFLWLPVQKLLQSDTTVWNYFAWYLAQMLRQCCWYCCKYTTVSGHLSLFRLSVFGRCCLDGFSIRQPIFCCSSHSRYLLPSSLSSTCFSQDLFGLSLFLWPFTLPSTINFSKGSLRMDTAPCKQFTIFFCFAAHKLAIFVSDYFSYLLGPLAPIGYRTKFWCHCRKCCGIGPAFVMCKIYTAPTFVAINLLLSAEVKIWIVLLVTFQSLLFCLNGKLSWKRAWKLAIQAKEMTLKGI